MHHRVSVGRRTGYQFGPDITAAPGAILDNPLRAHHLGQTSRNQPRNDVVGAAGRIGRNKSHGL
jgi:hypothetical protein